MMQQKYVTRALDIFPYLQRQMQKSDVLECAGTGAEFARFHRDILVNNYAEAHSKFPRPRVAIKNVFPEMSDPGLRS